MLLPHLYNYILEVEFFVVHNGFCCRHLLANEYTLLKEMDNKRSGFGTFRDALMARRSSQGCATFNFWTPQAQGLTNILKGENIHNIAVGSI